VTLGVAVALLLALAGAIVVACYDVPRPDCGFLCGPGGVCPDDYTCADNHRCRRTGAPATLVCPNPDADIPDDHDAAVDAAPEAGPDAPPDALPDGPEVAPDALPDALPDATTDAPQDAADDAPDPDAS
jgi:hypothetical protein